jgi:hypothetical protein
MRWSSAFAPSFHELYCSPQHKDFAGALVLQLHSKAAYIALSCTLSKTQMVFDNFLSEFKEIVALAKILLARSEANDAYTFDFGCIAQLYVVGIRCRDRAVRREAISLLLSKPW